MNVTLFTKEGCELCHEAEAVIRKLRTRIHFQLDLVYIDEDASAYNLYWDKVPVIAVDGVEVARAPLDERRLREMFLR